MRYILPLILALFLAMPVNAAFTGPGADGYAKQGGFSGPVSGVMADNVAAAKSLKDDAAVVLTGNIVSKVAGTKKKYIFKDSTGEIVIEISLKRFKGLNISPTNTIRISGKVDQDFGQEPEIEVKDLEVVN